MTNLSPAAPGEPARATRHRADRCYVRCAGEGEKVVLAFPFDAAMVREAKMIGERHFDWNTRTNVYPFTRLRPVVAFADAHGIDVAPQVRALVPAAATQIGQENAGRSQVTREAAHLYLSHGLLPVPAWAARDDGACCCRRGPACERPGKHPRSVHTGPGPHDYSWRPLACSTHEEAERRFAGKGEYAAANLMLAIPEQMLVIDQDYDDGGRQALAALAERLGELPATLSHGTPHGVHRIYRTPPGWTTRAWVGKDTRNPLPAGIDLRVPGQILMAPPSRVPTAEGLACYGPVAAAAVADLPAAYIAAWTPPRETTRVTRPQAAVPPGRADAAATYVHARITGIAEDLATRAPGGRNTAIYTAALKVGSTLGAARSMPGALQAAAWTDEAAEDALMAAAEHNGYIADHTAAAARSAIRSGLRNGLRDPQPLRNLGRRSTATGPMRQGPRADQELGTGGGARAASTSRDLAVINEPDTANSTGLPVASSHAALAVGQASTSTNAEPVGRTDLLPGQPCRAAMGDWRDSVVQKQREEWRPKLALPDRERAVAAETQRAEIGE